jgi:hypothetical protein
VAITEGSQAGDQAEGRAAADRLADSWPDRSWVTDAPSAAWARGAIERFGELLQEQPAIFRASREGSERGAESLSPRPYQGILESLQNADDVGATALRLQVVRGDPSELLIAHDGSPVDLGHAGAMLLPWLTTKADEAEASGRFGIGQQTLRSLGGPLEIHCPPFHFRLNSGGPQWVDPADDIEGLFSALARHTLIRVPLDQAVDVDGLLGFITTLDGRSLLFLRSVRRLALIDPANGDTIIEHRLAVEGQESLVLRLRDQDLPGEWTRLWDTSTERRYHRYLAEVPVGRTERRRHKALGGTISIGVAIPCQAGEPGGIYDRLPLPVPSVFPFSLNAPFDPDAARTTILELGWNERRIEDLGHLVAAATIDCSLRDPKSAWEGIPLRDEVAVDLGKWLADRFRSGVIDRAQERLGSDLLVTSPDGPRPLEDLAFEVEALDGVLTAADLKILEPDHTPVPVGVRDDSGRWRATLLELGRSHPVDVAKALNIFDITEAELGHREPNWFVGMGRAAVEADLLDEYLWKPSVLLADGRKVEPPGAGDPSALVAGIVQPSIGALLGIALPLHPSYLDGSQDARTVEVALREAGILLDDADSAQAAFEILGRGREASTMEPIRLDDAQIVSLRDAFETLEDERQRTLGPRVGENIELRGFVFTGRGTRETCWVRPVDAYLPGTIDKETGSFARAAGNTPGLRWLDGSYARVLKRAGGRKELGAQRFLVRLGAAAQPRLVRPTNETVPYVVDPRAASPTWGVPRPEIQLREIRAMSPARTHLLEDRWAPDLEFVIAAIAGDRNAKRRRARGLALLGVLSRAWERHYAERQYAQAVYKSYGWTGSAEVVATWLGRAAESPWLPSASGSTQAPIDLLLPTKANRIAYGSDRSMFLGGVDETILRGPAVQALRIRRGPAASSLIDKLRELSQLPWSLDVADEAKQIYHLLALAIPPDGRAAPIDDLSVAELRTSFAASQHRRGLLLAGEQWLGPKEVFSGLPIFGSHRPFVPHSPSLRPLWQLLGVHEPEAADCLSVLRELAAAPLGRNDVGVVLEATRALAGMLGHSTPQLRSQLGRMPLWTDRGWMKSRPIYAIEDSKLALDIAAQVPLWTHGFTSFSGLEDLIDALNVTVVRREDLAVSALTARDRVTGDRLRAQFSSAVEHLRDELARGDPALHGSIGVPWSALVHAELFIDQDLALTCTLAPGVSISVEADAHVARDPLALIVRSASLMASAEATGAAIASLFSGDRQKVSWAWASMWQRAEEGRASAGVVLSNPGGDEDSGSGTDRLLRLKGQVLTRRTKRDDKGTSPSGLTSSGSAPSSPIVVRILKDISQLEPSDGSIVNSGIAKPGINFPEAGSITRPEPETGRPDGGGAEDRSRERRSGAPDQSTPAPKKPLTRRTVLPPMTEREQLAFDAVQAALSIGLQEIADLRTRRGIGADAMDDLRQLYEIKMDSGELSNEITLTKTEAQAAQDPDFFLALVAGLEDGGVPLSVRFIFDPLSRLSQRITGAVTLVGLREVEALEYRFRKPDNR